MDLDSVARAARKLAKPYRVSNGKGFRLCDFDPGDTGPLKASGKKQAAADLAEDVAALAEWQDRLYAQDRWAVLLIFQAMDAAGKDGAIKHVMSGVNPQGCQVFSFKAPSSEELDHDYLWRCLRCLPERGRIGIFNRSYYEEVLVARVHPEILQRQKLPSGLVGRKLWKERFEDMRCFERYLSRNGVLVRKFFLNVSREEQKKRFLERLDDPEKHWKFNPADLEARDQWDDYQDAYAEAIERTSTDDAPWFVVPADRKWYRNWVVSTVLVETLERLDPRFPDPPEGLDGFTIE